MSSSKQRLGAWGERVAEAYLIDKGYRILERNQRTPYGELDLIVIQEFGNPPSSQVVFIEVKTRTSLGFGLPEEGIDAVKRAHLVEAAQHFMQSHPELGEDWRVDVIAIHKRSNPKRVEICHFENVISE